MNQLQEELNRLRDLMLIKETHAQIMKYDLERKYDVKLDIYESGNTVEWSCIEGNYDEGIVLKIEQALQSYCMNSQKNLIVLDNIRQ